MSEPQSFFVHDGSLGFGYGAHGVKDEVFVSGYKIFAIYTQTPEKYAASLGELGFRQEARLRTVRDTFTPSTPGNRSRIRVEGRTIYDMVDELKKEGLYLAERRED